jgi:ferritin
MFLPSFLSPFVNEQFEENASVTSRLAVIRVAMREAAVNSQENECGLGKQKYYRPVADARQDS